MSLSTETVRQMYSSNSKYIPVVLITVTHSSFSEPIRICTDNSVELEQNIFKEKIFGIVSRGKNYYFIPFQFKLPSSHTDEAPTASLSISNVGLDLMSYIRSIQPGQEKPKILLEVIIAQEPDEVIQSNPELTVTSINYNAEVVNFNLSSEDLSSEPFPSGTFNPTFFKGIFKGL